MEDFQISKFSWNLPLEDQKKECLEDNEKLVNMLKEKGKVKVYFYEDIDPENDERKKTPIHSQLKYDIFVYISYLDCSKLNIHYLPELYQCKTLICTDNRLKKIATFTVLC